MMLGAVDSYTREIIKNALTAIGDEMFAALARASTSPIILPLARGHHVQ
jgi:N-methylhydantoinase B/oxoprolinase/acetone carboxylase alpha subunit